MIELLQQYDFKFDGKCACDGYITHKYKRDKTIVSWRITKYQFKIKKDGMTIYSWMPVKVADEIFKRYFQEETSQSEVVSN
jgi:hypothetical protein